MSTLRYAEIPAWSVGKVVVSKGSASSDIVDPANAGVPQNVETKTIIPTTMQFFLMSFTLPMVCIVVSCFEC